MLGDFHDIRAVMEWVEIPCPPSANALFIRMRGKTIKTATYDRWISAAGWLMKAARVQSMGAARCMVEIQAKANNRRDLDNFAKPIMDLLVSMGVIRDDRMSIVREIRLTVGETTRVRVTPWSNDDGCKKMVPDAPMPNQATGTEEDRRPGNSLSVRRVSAHREPVEVG